MSEANKALVRRLYDEVNAGNVDIVDEIVADDFVDHEAFPGIPGNKEGVRQVMQMFRSAFPDFRITADDMIAEGDKVFVRATMTGTHEGELMGIAPTGKQISVAMADFIRIANGKGVEHWGVTDMGALMQQLGVVEAPATA